ncbi:hypothetical protein BOTBODRAFT_265732 [Botryobasidium botryosum FD-172 SS1]|uniref:Uncharacterized protein n=1 Tax=Botryobasidium botryosum (strain FD-172 SS1) TaxID=930990 RepID=A0A067MKD3_BOTB1|nr:hypothetical protein BOTBODRAFT_265732 [Botryobasidium botryosum FD-172 SS1]
MLGRMEGFCRTQRRWRRSLKDDESGEEELKSDRKSWGCWWPRGCCRWPVGCSREPHPGRAREPFRIWGERGRGRWALLIVKIIEEKEGDVGLYHAPGPSMTNPPPARSTLPWPPARPTPSYFRDSQGLRGSICEGRRAGQAGFSGNDGAHCREGGLAVGAALVVVDSSLLWSPMSSWARIPVPSVVWTAGET